MIADYSDSSDEFADRASKHSAKRPRFLAPDWEFAVLEAGLFVL
jgi:hypothetical protein